MPSSYCLRKSTILYTRENLGYLAIQKLMSSSESEVKNEEADDLWNLLLHLAQAQVFVFLQWTYIFYYTNLPRMLIREDLSFSYPYPFCRVSFKYTFSTREAAGFGALRLNARCVTLPFPLSKSAARVSCMHHSILYSCFFMPERSSSCFRHVRRNALLMFQISGI